MPFPSARRPILPWLLLASPTLLAPFQALAQEPVAHRHHPVEAVRHAAHATAHAVRQAVHEAVHPGARHGLHAPTRPAHPLPAHHAAVAPPPVPIPAAAAPPVPAVPAVGSNTGLPLPRFAALRAEVVNMRSGPGTRYPIQWVYKRRDLPVEVEREFDVWRLVEDADGVKGWVHQATLVGTRTFVIRPAPGSVPDSTAAADAPASAQPVRIAAADVADALTPGAQALRAAPQPDAAVVAILKPGLVGRIRACAAGSGWCRVSVRDYAGWLPRSAFWGLLPDEAILPP